MRWLGRWALWASLSTVAACGDDTTAATGGTESSGGSDAAPTTGPSPTSGTTPAMTDTSVGDASADDSTTGGITSSDASTGGSTTDISTTGDSTAGDSTTGGSDGTTGSSGDTDASTGGSSGETGEDPSCSDNVANGMETDIDCGGPMCPSCDIGGMCMAGSDCVSGVCDGMGTCAGPTCNDGVHNGNETDVDCGGPVCGACGVGQGCVVGSDCDSNTCNVGLGVCLSAECTDGIFNGQETDVDCGGPVCAACVPGDGCMVATDCDSLVCSAGVCATRTCNDGVQNQDETDVDCGGSICAACADGGSCVAPSDCASGSCEGGACVSCSDGVQNQDETGVDCGGATCGGCLGECGYLAPATVWNLPAPMAGYDADVATPKPFESVTMFSDDCGIVGETYDYEVLDVSGDGLVDIVVTHDSCVDVDIGRTYWRVFLGTPGGFSDVPTSWNLPLPMHGYDADVAEPQPFESATTHSDDCGVPGETYRYDVLDISGDGIVDLVLSDDSCIDDDIGRTYWRVFLGTALGFSDIATLWSLPAPMAGYDADVAAPKPFESVTTHADDCGVAGQTYRYDVLDVSGDGLVDIVLTDDTCVDLNIGRTHWRVFLGTALGFSDIPTSWSLPMPMHGYDADVAAPKPFESTTTHADDCGVPGQTYRYDVLDISGDGIVDLVLSDDSCVDDDIGRTYWRVFPGTALGFSDVPLVWNLPSPMAGYDADVAAPKPFESVTTHSDDCGVPGQTYRYDVLDISGDGLVDIVVVLDTCVHADIARTYWRVFLGTASGFSDTPSTWTLPAAMAGYDADVATPQPFESAFTHTDDCGVPGQTYRYDNFDISGDGEPDLVLTDDTCVDVDIGRTYWRVFAGGPCSP